MVDAAAGTTRQNEVFPGQVWQPFAPSSYAPSVWTLVHPAYGVVMASMDVNGHQVTNSYDDPRVGP